MHVTEHVLVVGTSRASNGTASNGRASNSRVTDCCSGRNHSREVLALVNPVPGTPVQGAAESTGERVLLGGGEFAGTAEGQTCVDGSRESAAQSGQRETLWTQRERRV